MEGRVGKILDINLTSGTIETLPLDMEMAPSKCGTHFNGTFCDFGRKFR